MKLCSLIVQWILNLNLLGALLRLFLEGCNFQNTKKCGTQKMRYIIDSYFDFILGLLKQISTTLTSLIKGHVPLLIFRKNSSLPAVFKAYPFIKSKKKFQPTPLLEAYPLIFLIYHFNETFILKLKKVKSMTQGKSNLTLS